jgi:hypothetical protein
MASGHVNRTERPNTWQHRPSLRREDSSCQPGAVHTWHEAANRVGALMSDHRGRPEVAVGTVRTAVDPQRTLCRRVALSTVLSFVRT